MGKFLQMIALWMLGASKTENGWKFTIDSPDFNLKAETKPLYDDRLPRENDTPAQEDTPENQYDFTQTVDHYSWLYLGDSAEEIQAWFDTEACVHFDKKHKPIIRRAICYTESTPRLVLNQCGNVEFVEIGDMIVVWNGRIMVYSVETAKDAKAGLGAKYYINHDLEKKKKGWE